MIILDWLRERRRRRRLLAEYREKYQQHEARRCSTERIVDDSQTDVSH